MSYEDYFPSLSALKSVLEEIAGLEEQKKELVSPLLTDLDLIPHIYKEFNLIRPPLPERRDAMKAREFFIFLILWYYSPGTLLGGKMLVGLRDRIADTIRVTTGSTVSNVYPNLYFLYKTHKTFRQELNLIYEEMERRLRERGWV